MSLINILNQQPIDFFYLCLDKFFEIPLPQLKNYYIISPEKLGITLTDKNSGRLLEHPGTQNFIQKISRDSGHRVAIIPFKPSAKIKLICQKNNWLCIANDPSINRTLEDKIKFSSLCDEFKISTIDHLIMPYSKENFLKAQGLLGNDLVIQTHFGWAGNSTHLFSKFSDSIVNGTLAKFSPYLNGFTILNNCCLTHLGLLQSPPALQYTGIKPLTKNPFTTVGRQWPAMISPEISDQVFQLTNLFTKVLDHYHYRGFFGLDFLVSDNKVYLLECNPRLTASSGFYTQIETKLNINPLYAYHLAEFLNLDFELINQFTNPLIQGSEITLKNSLGATIRRAQYNFPLSKTTNPIIIDQKYIQQLIND